ncbi:MAG: tetratricopeptide repeat protein [Muribaculum sp.]|nr:tetratricopeptide repeat protein [Muribaculum sp.]
MKKIKNIFIGVAMLCSLPLCAQQIDPMTRAMLKSYEELLRQDPKDYMTLYDRAAKYFQLSLYDKAFADITKALEYTPAKETEMAIQELSLLADIDIATKNYSGALTAIDKALGLSPDNYPNLYKKGNIQLYLNQPEEAYKTFQKMQRLKSRSQEAFFGMAKASIMMDKTADAESLMKEAQAADPSNYITYCRLGDLYSDMKQYEQAANSYIMAFSLANNPQRPLEGLLELAKKDYPSVGSAIDYNINRTENKSPYYFLKGYLAYNGGYYSDAENAAEKLIAQANGREGSSYSLLAKSQFALNDLENALKNVNQALQTDDKFENRLLKAQILNAYGQPAAALLEAKQALELEPTSTEAAVEAAKAMISNGNNSGAIEYLNEAVMSDPENILPLMLRGYVYDTLLGNSKQSVADYTRASMIETEEFPQIAYKALAKAKAGKLMDANTIIEKAISDKANDKEALYYAAVYYSQTGNLEKGKELLDRALQRGYQNKYNIESDKTANLNISPIRHLVK